MMLNEIMVREFATVELYSLIAGSTYAVCMWICGCSLSVVSYSHFVEKESAYIEDLVENCILYFS